MTRCILALDLALHSGFAVYKEGDAWPEAGLLEVSKHKDLGGRLASLNLWGIRAVKRWPITDIAVETPIAGGGHEDKIFWLISAFGVFNMIGSQYKIHVKAVANSDFFPFWCGTNRIEGEQRKHYSVLEAQRRGLGEIIKVDGNANHNVADACGVLAYRCHQMGVKTPWDSLLSPGPLFTGRAEPKGVTITKANQRAATLATSKVLSFNRGE